MTAIARFLPAFILLVALAGLVPNAGAVEPTTCEGLKGLALSKCRLEMVQTPAGFNAENDPVVIVGKVINIFLALLGVIFLVLTVYGGYLWMTARGDEQQVTKAKDVLKAAAIGLGITLGAYAISSFVVSRLAATTTGQVI